MRCTPDQIFYHAAGGVRRVTLHIKPMRETRSPPAFSCTNNIKRTRRCFSFCLYYGSLGHASSYYKLVSPTIYSCPKFSSYDHHRMAQFFDLRPPRFFSGEGLESGFLPLLSCILLCRRLQELINSSNRISARRPFFFFFFF